MGFKSNTICHSSDKGLVRVKGQKEDPPQVVLTSHTVTVEDSLLLHLYHLGRSPLTVPPAGCRFSTLRKRPLLVGPVCLSGPTVGLCRPGLQSTDGEDPARHETDGGPYRPPGSCDYTDVGLRDQGLLQPTPVSSEKSRTRLKRWTTDIPHNVRKRRRRDRRHTLLYPEKRERRDRGKRRILDSGPFSFPRHPTPSSEPFVFFLLHCSSRWGEWDGGYPVNFRCGSSMIIITISSIVNSSRLIHGLW